jgi:hypothetical protein
MGKIKVHGGDFIKNSEGSFSFGVFSLKTESKRILGEAIHSNTLSFVEVASEENIKKLSGTLGWGFVGAVALGPLGLLAGALVGGRKKEVTFIAEFSDGRKLLATTDKDTFIKIQAATM